jgi:hypothetical protein
MCASGSNKTDLLIQPTYFAQISQYAHIVNSEQLVFEVCDNYQKQTYRNRCYIDSSNGKQLLNIPIVNEKGIKQKTAEVKIDNKYGWQRLHWKSLQTVYNASPYYEFYIDDLRPVFERSWNYLIDLNLYTHECILAALELSIPYKKTTSYEIITDLRDKRILVNAKQDTALKITPYYQVFDDKHGFIPDLSILDLLFMEGPNALNYLEQLQI